MSELCAATTANDEPCKNRPMIGSDLCQAHLRRRGRPTLLTDELADELVGVLRAGNYLAVACRAVGISRPTFGVWMRRGKSDAPEDEPYRILRDRVSQARAQAEAAHVAVISRSARDGNWAASAWMLEREFPERWGRVSVRARDDSPVDDEPAVADDDPFREVDELAEKRRVRGAG